MASRAGVGIPKKKQEVSIPKMPDKKSNKKEAGIPKKPKKRKGGRPLPCPVGKKKNAQGKCVVSKDALPPKYRGKGKASNKSPKKGVRKPNKKPNAACIAKANGMIRRGQAMKRRCKSRPTIQK